MYFITFSIEKTSKTKKLMLTTNLTTCLSSNKKKYFKDLFPKKDHLQFNLNKVSPDGLQLLF